MPIERQTVTRGRFNAELELPFNLRIDDVHLAMQDVYDFLFDVNSLLQKRGLQRFDDFLRPAAMSGIISDMLTASMATHARSLTENNYHNGHPDLIVKGIYPNDSVESGEKGLEIKTTRKSGGGVDMHGARAQWLAVFTYAVDNTTEPAIRRTPMQFREVFIARVEERHFRVNNRGKLGTRTASLNREGLQVLRGGRLYSDLD